MKKYLYAAGILSVISSSVNAFEVKPYLGADLGIKSTTLENNYMGNQDEYYFNAIDTDYKAPTKETDFDEVNFAFNFGAKFKFQNNFFFDLEGYINLGNLIDKTYKGGFDYTPDGSVFESYNDSIKVNNLYGFRTNIGYTFYNKFSVFAVAGINVIDYESRLSYYLQLPDGYISLSDKCEEDELAYSFGLGFSYNITKHFEARLSYEFTKFTIKDKMINSFGTLYGTEIDQDVDITNNSFKLGFNYIF